jgi:4-hydroxybenzoate polyprenyltransferase
MGVLLFFSHQYSAPPLRLKERPPFDSVSNGFIYYFAPVMLGSSFGTVGFNAPLQLYIITLAVMGIHSFSTVTDYSVDKEVGDRTFAVVYGKRAAALFSLIVFAIAYFAPTGYQGTVINWYLLLLMILSFIIILYPSERLATVFFYTIGAAFVVVAVILIQSFWAFWS